MTLQTAITSLVNNNLELTEDLLFEMTEQFNESEETIQLLYDYEFKK